MREVGLYDVGAPMIEVRIYSHGELIERTLCESEEEAAAVVEQWSEQSDVTFLVDDLSFRHQPGDILAPEPMATYDLDAGGPIAQAEIPARGVD